MLRVRSRQRLNQPQREKGRFWSEVPALLESEDERAYLALRSEIEQAMAPEDVFERMRVQDLTDKLWEERRLKHSYANVIASARVEALASLLRASYGDEIPIGEDVPSGTRVAQEYFSSESPAHAQAVEIVRRLGITPEMINASAVCLRIGIIQTLDEMCGRRENMRRHLMKDHERQQRRAHQQMQRSPGAPDRVTSIRRLKRD